MRDDVRGLVAEMLEMTAGPLLWFAHLGAVYVTTTLVCAGHLTLGSGESRALFAGAGLITVLALAGAVWLLVRAVREHRSGATTDARRFVNRVTIALSGFAILAILWTALPVALTPSCDPPLLDVAQAARQRSS